MVLEGKEKDECTGTHTGKLSGISPLNKYDVNSLLPEYDRRGTIQRYLYGTSD